MTEEDVISYVVEKLRIKYSEDDKSNEDLEDAVEDCISMFKRLSNQLELETFTKVDANWIKRACVETIQRTDDGMIGIKEYQEGNIRYTFQRENLSRALVLELFPMVGYPK